MIGGPTRGRPCLRGLVGGRECPESRFCSGTDPYAGGQTEEGAHNASIATAQLTGVGAIVRHERLLPEDAPQIRFVQTDDEDSLVVQIDYFADLVDGRRLQSDWRHGERTVSMAREGIGAIYRRYHGPSPDPTEMELESYRVTVGDVEDAVRESHGLPWRERADTWVSYRAFLWNEIKELASRWRWNERRERWVTLRAALEEHGVEARDRDLDRLPFRIEIDEEVRRELAPWL